MVTRKVILHLDNADQAIFVPTVMNRKLFPELKIQRKKLQESQDIWFLKHPSKY